MHNKGMFEGVTNGRLCHYKSTALACTIIICLYIKNIKKKHVAFDEN